MDNQPYYFMKNPGQTQTSNVFDLFSPRAVPSEPVAVQTKKGSRTIRSAAFYAQAAKNAVAQGQRDVGAALAREPETLSIKSWLMSTNPNDDDPSKMTLQNKLIIGAVVLGAFMIFMKRK